MTNARNTSRQKLLDSAIGLFARQGMTETTTKQIAELAEVNEVTLFRQFGNKQGLLLAMMQESEMFDRLAESLAGAIEQPLSPREALEEYAASYLQLLGGMPELLRSVIGEAGKYPLELKQGLGQGLQRANQAVLEYLQQMKVPLAPVQLNLFNSAMLGYAVLELTTEFHGLWDNRTAFIHDLVALVMPGNQLMDGGQPFVSLTIHDLPATIVHQIFQRAQKQGLREWALVYLLFGAGVSPVELVGLERFHHVSDRDLQFLQITQGAVRQIPVNQWIMGKRYGTYQKNPLTQYLKSRKDSQTALLIGADEQRLTLDGIEQIWQTLTHDLLTLAGQPPTLAQPQQTWCVEMLMRGLTVEDMQILTGMSIEQLTPYSQRAKQKAVLEQGLALDKQKKD
jgi:AcrR family transcriptional regulator